MTEQSKIPVPGKKGEEARAGASLIERAVGSIDLNAFLPPPVPKELVPQRPQAKVQQQPVAQPAPVESEVAPEPPAVPAPVVPEPVVAEAAQPISQPVAAEHVAVPAAEPTPMAAEPEPVSFGGERHPVDREHLREQGLIVPEGKVTGTLEEFRIVKRQLLVQASDLKRKGDGMAAQRVLVSSPHPNEGKTYCALNLALSIAAEKESEVLLVDADFAKPSILTALGLPAGPGLMDALRDPDVDVADFVIGTDVPGLWVLPAGDTTNSDTEYLGSSRTRRVLDRLTEGAPHRIVLFDSPPALAASPAAEIAKYVAQVVMVVRADKTGHGALEDAISLLSACPNIQLLLNGVHFSPSGRSFGTYYGYGG